MGIQIPKLKTDGGVFGQEEILTPIDFLYFDCRGKVYDKVVMSSGGKMQPIQEIEKAILESRQELEVYGDALENIALMTDVNALTGPHRLKGILGYGFIEYKLTIDIGPRVYGASPRDLADLIRISAKNRCVPEFMASVHPWETYWERA